MTVGLVEQAVDTRESLRELLAQLRAEGYTHAVVANGRTTGRGMLWNQVPIVTTPDLPEGEGMIVPLVLGG